MSSTKTEVARSRARQARKRFHEAAIRYLERYWSLPRGWWGNYSDAHGPGGRRVKHSRGYWVLTRNGVVIGRYDSRSYAIAKARALR